MAILLEVCVDDLAGLQAAIKGGADRVELCSALALGGLTPSAGLMELAATFDIPCTAMIRPRAGDFVFVEQEIEIMLADIEAARKAGLAGVVLGASLPDGRLDAEVLEALVKAAHGLDLTLHRAFDLVPDLAQAVEIAVKLGFSRVLTSGRAKSAIDGVEDIRRTVDAAAGRISIMPGAGISVSNVMGIAGAMNIQEVHASCSTEIIREGRVQDLGFGAHIQRRTDAAIVRGLKQTLSSGN